jgi:hypothetical protein
VELKRSEAARRSGPSLPGAPPDLLQDFPIAESSAQAVCVLTIVLRSTLSAEAAGVRHYSLNLPQTPYKTAAKPFQATKPEESKRKRLMD